MSMRRHLWSGLVAATTLTVTACGPMPGYYPDDRRYVPPAEEADGPADPGGEEDGPAYDSGGTAAGQQPIRIVHTQRRDAYYLIDPNRRLCFFHQAGAMSPVDCGLLPEAQDLAEAPAPEPRTAASSRRAEEAPYPEADPDEGADERADDEPIPEDGEPLTDEAPVGPPEPLPETKPAAPELGKAPTEDERRRFTLAYIAISCDGRKNAATDPAKHITESGLTPERFSQIEGWVVQDEKAWRALTLAARAACPLPTGE